MYLEAVGAPEGSPRPWSTTSGAGGWLVAARRAVGPALGWASILPGGPEGLQKNKICKHFKFSNKKSVSKGCQKGVISRPGSSAYITGLQSVDQHTGPQPARKGTQPSDTLATLFDTLLTPF